MLFGLDDILNHQGILFSKLFTGGFFYFLKLKGQGLRQPVLKLMEHMEDLSLSRWSADLE